MTYKLKTEPTDSSVIEFIEAIESVKKKEDAYRLLDLYTEVTGMEPKMWGPSIIGFGSYHYRYDSGHEGDAALAGFSPRKSAHALYITMGEERKKELLEQLGKHRTGKVCVYVNKLADIDLEVLKVMIKESMEHTLMLFPQS